MKTIVGKTVYLLVVLFTSIMMNAQSNTNMKDYEQEWAEIDSLLLQETSTSLLPKADAIYQLALKEKNYVQLLKAIIFQLNCIGVLEDNEEGVNRIFDTLKKDAEVLPQPTKSIVYSMLGQMYEEYYDMNKGTISLRTAVNIEQQDVRTWDNRKLADEAVKYYALSLSDVETLQNEPVENYRAILLQHEDVSYQPTLYDLLANRALKFYSSYTPLVPSPQTVFVINNPDYFADAQTFSNLNIQTEDTLSVAFLSLKTYQDLLRFHLKRSDAGFANSSTNALIDVDLRRVVYLSGKGRGYDAEYDILYEEALVRMSKVYHAYSQNVDVLLRLASHYFLQAGYSKAYEICEQIEKDYPHQQGESVKGLKELILRRELSMQTESVQLPNQPFLAQVKFKNIETLYKAIYRLTEEQAFDYTENIGSFSYNRNRDRFSTFIQSLKGDVLQEQATLPSVSDFQSHTTEIKMSPMKDGLYLIVLSDAKEWLTSSTVYATAMVQVSPLMAQSRSVNGMLSGGVFSVIVTDYATGKPVEGAKITTYPPGKVQTLDAQETISDKNGIATIKSNKPITRTPLYRVSAGDRQLIEFNRSFDQNINRRNEKSSVVFTDRSIYRPGQTVYFSHFV